jgi:hypothetical protein
MPGFDSTGPMGFGPMTGGRRGFCGIPHSGYGTGNRWFMSRGGRGWRNRFYATGLPGWARASDVTPAAGWVNPWAASPYGTGLTSQQEMEVLKEEAETLQKNLEEINERISTLEKAQVQKEK